jgi:hypothetical protein
MINNQLKKDSREKDSDIMKCVNDYLVQYYFRIVETNPCHFVMGII